MLVGAAAGAVDPAERLVRHQRIPWREVHGFVDALHFFGRPAVLRFDAQGCHLDEWRIFFLSFDAGVFDRLLFDVPRKLDLEGPFAGEAGGILADRFAQAIGTA